MKLKACLLALSAALLAACQTIEPAPAIDVTLVNLAFGEATLLETTILCTIRIQNPAPAPLKLEGAVHKLYLNGSYIGHGTVSESTEVPRLGTTTQTAKVFLSNLTLVRRLRPIVETQQVDYQLKSTFYARENDRSRRLATDSAGGLSLNDFKFPLPVQ